MELLEVEERIVAWSIAAQLFSTWLKVQYMHSPACSSRDPFNKDASLSFVSAVAACAVGVDPTESTNGVTLGLTAGMPCNNDSASPAAALTESTSADKKDFAASKEVEAYDCPAWQ